MRYALLLPQRPYHSVIREYEFGSSNKILFIDIWINIHTIDADVIPIKHQSKLLQLPFKQYI